MNAAPARGTASRVLFRFTWGRGVIVRQTVIEAGGTSGWHYHDGMLFVLVARRSRRHFRQRGVAGTYVVFNTPTICAGS